MQSQPTTWLLILGPISLLILLGLIATVVAVLWNPRTRPFGLALLGVFGVLGLLVFGMFSVRTTVVRDYESVPMVQFPNDTYSSSAIPAIELEAAREDMQAIVPIAEIVEQLNAQGDQVKSESEEEKSGDPAGKKEPPSASHSGSSSPDWLAVLPKSVGGVYRQVVDSGPWSELSDCQRRLNEEIRRAVEERVRQIASEELRRPVSAIPALESLGISTNWIQQEIVSSSPEPFVKSTDSSVGPMNTAYVQLEFDQNDQEFLRQKYRDYARQDRIAAVTTGGVFLLGGIGLLFGLLKVDTWTKGYYTKRLFLGVPAAIIGAGTLLALFIA